MEKIKDSTVIKFLMSKDIKTKCIKLAIVLCLMFLTFFNNEFSFIVFAFCATYVAFEFSADSIFWIILVAIFVPHISISVVHILMCEIIVILLTQLIIDISKSKIHYKNWRFVTLVCLYIVLCLLLLLPLAKTYNFAEQAKRLLLFTTVWLGVFYINEINIKHMLVLFVVSIISLCLLFLLAIALDGGVYMAYNARYSNGVVDRFSAFCNDPNFTGAILVCAIAGWFVAYKKKIINKYIYFGGLGFLGYFSLWTISKATCLIIAVFALYVIVENIVISIKTKQPKHLLELLWYAGILVLACTIGWKFVDAMYKRIFNPGEGWWSEGESTTSISNLTTGRTNLWIDYIKYILASWQVLMFGAGADSDYISMGAAHSMPLDYLYRYGVLIVLILISIFIISALPYLKKAKPYNFVPLVLITGIFCSIGSISAKYIYLFAIEFLTLCFNGVEAKRLEDGSVKQEQDIVDKTNKEDSEVGKKEITE